MNSQQKIAIKGPRTLRLWKKLFEYESWGMPVIAKLNDMSFVCSQNGGQIQIPNDMTLEEVNTKFTSLRITEEIKEWTVDSSNGKSKYTITKHGKEFKCNCPGFTYHARCRHTDQIRKEVEST